MIKILYYTLIAFLTSIGISWMLDNNGLVLIRWLGYEAQTDILTMIFAIFLSMLTLSAIFHLFLAALSIRFPWLMRLFFRRTYTKTLEKIIARQHQAFDQIVRAIIAIELNDKKSFKILNQKLQTLIKRNSVQKFFAFKQAIFDGNLTNAEKLLIGFEDDKNSKILLLKVQMQIAIKNQQNLKALACGNQILELNKENLEIVHELIVLYKNSGQWHMAKHLISEYGADNFSSELQKHNKAVINTALATESYRSKKYNIAIKYSKIALQSNFGFVPANEILIKSMIKLGMRFRAIYKIRHLWKENPCYIYAKFYQFLHRKSKISKQVKALKSLFHCHPKKLFIEDLLLAELYFRASDFQSSKTFLTSYLKNEESQNGYLLLANLEKSMGNDDSYQTNLSKSKLFKKTFFYECSHCKERSLKWNATCQNCGQYDCIEWNF